RRRPGALHSRALLRPHRHGRRAAGRAAHHALRDAGPRGRRRAGGRRARHRAARQRRGDRAMRRLIPVALAVGAGLAPFAFRGSIGSVGWFDTDRAFYLAVVLAMGASLFWYIRQARRRPEDVYIRRIPGVDAIEEAVGRSTEMGRPVLYVTG